MTTNVPDFRVTLDGRDLTDRIRPRLMSLSLTERRGGDADELQMLLDDSDGLLAIPPTGAMIALRIGWARGGDVTPGLIDKGRFVVDQMSYTDPPAQLQITARSADFTGALARRREQSWHDTTIGAVITQLAGRNGLQARCAPALAAIALPALVQSRESDIALLRRLGREHDAVATIKHGALIFAPIGAGTTATGRALPTATIRRSDGDRYEYRIEKRESVKGVTASWHDRAGATKRDVTVGEADGSKRLARTYPTEAAARAAAAAELKHGSRQPVALDLTLALGRADLAPEQAVSAAGFKPPIDGAAWHIAEVSHDLSDRGFSTGLKLKGSG